MGHKANSLSIAVTTTLTIKICKEWVGKGEDLLQELWERGFINEVKFMNYRIKMVDEMEMWYLNSLQSP